MQYNIELHQIGYVSVKSNKGMDIYMEYSDLDWRNVWDNKERDLCCVLIQLFEYK